MEDNRRELSDEQDVRDPTGLLKLIRQEQRLGHTTRALSLFGKLDQSLTKGKRALPQQWCADFDEEWLDWETRDRNYKASPMHLQLKLGRTVARLKLAHLGQDKLQLTWDIYVLESDDEELDNKKAVHPYAMGLLFDADVTHYYSDRMDDFWAQGRERCHEIMYMLNERMKDE